MEYIERLRDVMAEEKLNPRQLSDLIDVPLTSVKYYLSEKREPSHSFAQKLSNHPRFQKYTLWLMTGLTAPESGQVCPAFSTQDTQGIVQKKA